MSKLNNILKENFELKQELENTVRLVKENEAKHLGFKAVQYSLLLSDSLREISEKPMRYLEEIFNIERAALFIAEGAYVAANGMRDIGLRVKVAGPEAFSYTFLEKRTLAGTDVRLIHKYFRVCPVEGDYSFVLVPVADDGKITASLGFYSSDTERFASEHNFDFINELAFAVSIALRKINSAYMLEMRAQTDYLTGLPNKSMMEITAKRWLERYRDHKTPFVFALLDLDNFKKVNDVLGHVAGDEVLMKTALALRETIGGNDILGRFGGDEFYLFLESEDEERVDLITRNILKAVRSVGEETPTEPRLGISAGAARVPEDMEKAATFMELVKLADERLRFFKKSGEDERNAALKNGFYGAKHDNR